MSCDLFSLANPAILQIDPYQPGKSIADLQRELGIKDIIKLASNENPLGASEKAMQAIRNFNEITRYPDGHGTKLKHAIAERLQLDTDQITLGNGSNELLELVARTFLQPNDEVIYAEHAFAVYPIVTQAVGACSVTVPMLNWQHDLAAMRSHINEKTRLIFIANPNNPTGTWCTQEELKSFLDQVPDHVLVLIDEAYFEYACERADYPNTSLWLSDYHNLIVTRTFSKAYGLASLRIGYSLSNPDIADLLNRVRQPFNNNAYALVAAEQALADEYHINQCVQLNQQGMAQYIDMCQQLGLSYIPSEANFICIQFGQGTAKLYESLLHQGIIVRPVANYQMPEYLRISIGLEHENQRCIETLNAILSS